MCNELFSIGPFTVYGYGLMIAIGIIAAYLTGEYRAKKCGIDPDSIFGLVIWAVLAGVLGGKLLYYITQISAIMEDPSLLLDIKTGFVIYGALIGGILGVILYCRVKKYNFWSYFDLTMPSVALAQGFGRIGCFLAGCCYGMETSGPFAVVFTNSEYAPNGISLLPTQLISSALDFLHFVVLIVFAKKFKKREGQVAGLYFILYSIGRFILEYFRGDLIRGNVGSLSTSQFISLFIFVFGCFAFFAVGKKKEKQEEIEEEITEPVEDENVSEEDV